MDYHAQEALDAELNASPFKARNEGSDTDFQAHGAESDAADDSTPAEETDFPPKEEIGPKNATPKQPKQPTIKGEDPSLRPLPNSL